MQAGKAANRGQDESSSSSTSPPSSPSTSENISEQKPSRDNIRSIVDKQLAALAELDKKLAEDDEATYALEEEAFFQALNDTTGLDGNGDSARETTPDVTALTDPATLLKKLEDEASMALDKLSEEADDTEFLDDLLDENLDDITASW